MPPAVDPLYTLLRNWATQIFNTEQSLGLLIVESNQDIPKAKKDDIYLSIDYTSSRSRIGRGYKAKADKITGLSKVKNNWLNTIEIREVNGNGDLLEELVETSDRDDIISLFNEAGFALLTSGPVQMLPSLPENTWKRESVVELTIHSGKEFEENTGFINNTETEGTIPAEGRAGDHTVENIISGG